jgi:exonuclease III
LDRGKALRLACWNADGVRSRKLELEHFLSQHGVDICLLSEKFLDPGQAFRLANYVCYRTVGLTVGAVQPS